MAAVALLGGAALYVLYSASQTPATTTAPGDVKRAFTGQLDTQQAVWTRRPFPPQNSGALPYAVRRPRPQLIESRLLLAEDEAALQPRDFREYQRALIEDHEPLNYPFSGDRASLWKDRERRRMPFINHPNSAYATLRTTPESADVVPIVQRSKQQDRY